MEYTIAAIPTMYRGRQYRSRLEARWASFFDVAGWQPEYEPMDLGKWSPDFSVQIGRDTWLVEVKPITEFSVHIGQKMVSATSPHSGIFGLLLVGVAPVASQDEMLPALIGYTNPVVDGAFAGWRNSYLLYVAAKRTPKFHPLIGSLESLKQPEVRAYSALTMAAWADASNSVQWNGPGQ